MTSLQRLTAALLGQSVDHIPFSPFLAYVWESYSKETQQQGQLAFHHRIGADPMWRGSPCAAKLILPEQYHEDRRETADHTHTSITTPVGSLHYVHQRSPQGNTAFLVNYSPAQYRQFIAPQIAGWCRTLRTHGKHYLQHACGHVRDLLPAMVEQGNLGIESISPSPTGNISIRDARSATGKGFAVIGGIEPTHFLRLEGAELDAYVHGVLDEGAGGAFVLANSDSCPPGVTEAKFAQVAAIARNWRM